MNRASVRYRRSSIVEIDNTAQTQLNEITKTHLINQAFLDINNDTSWMTNAIESTCQGNDWNKLLEELYNNTNIQLKNMNYNKRFTELTEKEQSILMESQYQKMCDEESSRLSLLDFNFSKAIDNELVKLLKRINNVEHEARNNADNTVNSNNTAINNDANNNNEKTEPVTKNRLLEVTLNAVIEAFDNSPPEFAAAPKIFLNRPLPLSFRPYVWNASLLLAFNNMEYNIDFSSISSMLDELISRRCLSLLDEHYSKISSRWMSAIVTEMIIKFMHINSINFPKHENDFHDVDNLFFLIIPLITVFSNGREVQDNNISSDTSKSDSNTKNNSNFNGKLLLTNDMDDKLTTELMIKALVALLSKTHMNLLKPGKGLEQQSPVIARVELYLHQKDEYFLDYLSKLHIQNDESDNPEWKYFFNLYLLKGLNGLLPHDTCLFVWDQGYIMSFHKALSIVLSSLLLSFKDVITEPVEPWPNSRTAFNTFCTYCNTISVTQLQRILSQIFATELGEEFTNGRGYSLEEDDGILMAVYKKASPEVDSAAVENMTENENIEAAVTSDEEDRTNATTSDEEDRTNAVDFGTKAVVEVADVLEKAAANSENDEEKSKKSNSSD